MGKQDAKQQIIELINKYRELLEAGELKSYSEAQTRNEFIEPLFGFLGWDMRNQNVRNEVTMEEGGVDITFKINNVPVMLLEAKSFGQDIDKLKWAEQAFNYSWNKGVTWAVLTDFETIKVFNAEVSVKAVKKSIFLELSWQKYISDFDDLWMLSREGFNKGLLTKKAEKYGSLTKRKPVGDKLFEDLTTWRTLLTKSVGRSNKLSEDELDEGIQKILDRLVFIRTAEDRKLEANVLQSILNSWESRGQKGSLYEQLVSTLRNFDEGYDSTLFGPHNSEKWKIDNDVIAQVIDGLYETKDGYRYDFAAISVDVLGSIYQHYLGYVQQKGQKSGEVAESKKRKKQGIFYTPRYIADFIVKETLGEVLKKTKPKDISKIKVLDPACGSGSFLTAAYDEFISYYEKQKRPKDQTNLFTRLDVLKNNLYGVDLDAQAVEIAQLNLLLKVLFQRGRLPSLQNNIRNGNSLVSGDEDSLRKYFGENWQNQKPFSWQEEFKEVFDKGGFDAIIGNRPWSAKFSAVISKMLAKQAGWSKKNVNTCSLFLNMAFDKLKPGGLFGFLLPKVFIKNSSYFPIRKKILNNFHIKKIADFGQFPGVASDAIALILEKRHSLSESEVIFYSGDRVIKQNKLNQKIFSQNPQFIFSLSSTPEIQKILDKIKRNSTALAKIVNIKRGIELGQKSDLIRCSRCGVYNEAHEKYYAKTSGKKCKECSAVLDINNSALLRISSPIKKHNYLLRCISGAQLDRYYIKSNYFIPPHLKGIDYKRDAFFSKKILIKRISTQIEGVFSDEEVLAFNTVYSLYKDNLSKNSFLSLLGILNSRLMKFFYEYSYNIGMALTTQVTIEFLSKLPVPAILEQKMLTDNVENIPKLNTQLHALSENGSEYLRVKREIEKLDRQIDQEVYKLYGLTAEEIKIVES